jgi:precorrin-6B methylase 2
MKPRTMLLVLVVLFCESGAVWARGFGGGGGGGAAHGVGMTGHPGSGVMQGRFRGTSVGSGAHAQAGFRSSNPFLGNRFVSVVPFRQAAVRVFPGAVFFPHSHFFRNPGIFFPHSRFFRNAGILIVDVPEFDVTTVTTQSESSSEWAPPRMTEGSPADPRMRAQGQLAPFDPTSQEVVYRMLALAGIKKGDVVYDLGSGDGRMVIAAAKKYGVKAVGYEVDPGLVKLARENIRKQGVEKLVEIRQQDFMKADLSPATIVTLYLSYDGNLALRPRLMNQLKPGARVVSYTFDMGDWAPKITEAYRDAAGDTHLLYYWELSAPEAYGDNSAGKTPSTAQIGSSQRLSFVATD